MDDFLIDQQFILPIFSFLYNRTLELFKKNFKIYIITEIFTLYKKSTSDILITRIVNIRFCCQSPSFNIFALISRIEITKIYSCNVTNLKYTKHMKHTIFPLIIIFFFLPGCTSSDKEKHQSPPAAEIKKNQAEIAVDLNESTEIILELLKKNDIKSILSPEIAESHVDNTKDTIDTLLKNFSPAQMAFEAEVLNFNDPVIILYYDSSSSDYKTIMNGFLETALANQHNAKFVYIEVKKLFSLADYAEINEVPTVLLMYHRSEQGRIENIYPSLLQPEIMKLLEKITDPV